MRTTCSKSPLKKSVIHSVPLKVEHEIRISHAKLSDRLPVHVTALNQMITYLISDYFAFLWCDKNISQG